MLWTVTQPQHNRNMPHEPAACEVLRQGTMTSRAAEGFHPVPRRIFEVLPPALAWVAITSPAWAAILAPPVLGYFLVAFSGYWLWRSVEFTVGLLIGLA